MFTAVALLKKSIHILIVKRILHSIHIPITVYFLEITASRVSVCLADTTRMILFCMVASKSKEH